jgi:hypothetical protein
MFDAYTLLAWQLNVLGGTGPHRVIAKTEMSSVVFFEPYCHLKIDDTNTKLAQAFRTYLRGCFALRGHAARDLVSVDLAKFAQSVASIKARGYGAAPSKTQKSTASTSAKESWLKVLVCRFVAGSSDRTDWYLDGILFLHNFNRLYYQQ